jgi:hypothetical protein
MCFSERVSWLTLCLSAVGSARGLAIGDPAARALCLTLAVVGSMQLYEALLWRNPRNLVAARAAIVTNHIQPLVFWAATWAFLGTAGVASTAALAAYLAVAAPYVAEALRDPEPVRVTSCGLEWRWNGRPRAPLVYALFLASAIATGAAYGPGVVLVIALSYVASHALYADCKMIGSMWCFFAAFFPWLAV